MTMAYNTLYILVHRLSGPALKQHWLHVSYSTGDHPDSNDQGHIPVFLYKLRYIVGFGSVEMAISTNPTPTIYRNLYKNTGPGI